MLVITRHVDEVVTFTIQGRELARVRIVRVEGDRVRLGIDAPKTIVINRAEGPPKGQKAEPT